MIGQHITYNYTVYCCKWNCRGLLKILSTAHVHSWTDLSRGLWRSSWNNCCLTGLEVIVRTHTHTHTQKEWSLSSLHTRTHTHTHTQNVNFLAATRQSRTPAGCLCTKQTLMKHCLSGVWTRGPQALSQTQPLHHTHTHTQTQFPWRVSYGFSE